MKLVEIFSRYRGLIKAAMPAMPGAIEPTAAQPVRRAVEAPLVAYYRLVTFKQQYETLPRSEFGRLDEDLRAAADALESQIESDKASPVTAWSALALHVAGKIVIRDA